jgi:hypothetical protein
MGIHELSDPFAVPRVASIADAARGLPCFGEVICGHWRDGSAPCRSGVEDG